MTAGMLSFGGSGTIWAPISIDGGGFVTGMDVASDGTQVCRCDVFCGYVRSPSSTTWTRLLTSTSMPAQTFFLNASSGWINPTGVFEVRIAPSNTQIFYMLYNGLMFKSTNQGSIWVLLSNFPTISWAGDENNNQSWRYMAKKMAVHPTDPNTLVVGTPANGAYYSTDGGASWTHISGITTATTRQGTTGVVFDPATPTTIFACSAGNGVYQTTTGPSGTWSLLSGSPTTVSDALVTNANYICCDSTHIQKFASGSWAQASVTASNGYWCITVDPVNANHLVALDQAAGQPAQSHDGGTTWANISYTIGSISSSGDVPWLSLKSPSNGFFLTGAVWFDYSIANRIWMSFGNGVVYSDNIATTTGAPVPGGTITWTPKTAGIQELVARRLISPPGGIPVGSAEDCQEFLFTNVNVNPSAFGISNQGAEEAGIGLDYAKSSPNTVVAFNSWAPSSPKDVSGFFGASPSLFTTKPTAGFGTVFSGGNIAAASATSIVALAFNQTNPVVYTTDGGTTWNAASGLPTFTWPNGANSWTVNTQLLCCDDNGIYYVYINGSGTYFSANGGATWTLGSSTNLSASEYFQPMIKSVPGNAGHLLYAQGGANGSTLPNSLGNLSYSTNAGASMTWNTIANIENVFCVGFGQIAPGQSYPTVWINGWINQGSGYKYGIWVNKLGPPFTASGWTFLIDFPFGSIDQVADISGDANDYTRCYLAFNGSSFGYGRNLVY